MQTGLATLIVGGDKQEIRLRLTEDTLYLEKQELAYTYSPSGHVDLSTLTKVRVCSQIIIFSHFYKYGCYVYNLHSFGIFI